MGIAKNMAIAEDAVQAAFMSVIKHKENYLRCSCSDFRRLIVTIVHNKTLDILKNCAFIADTPIDEMEPILVSSEPPVDEQVITLDEIRRMTSFISQIDEASRTVLYMKYEEGLTYKEIAERLGMTEKHVETKIARAKDKARKIAKKAEGNHE